MKVLQICKYFPPVFGGIEQVAYDISDGFLSEYNIPVDVFCVNDINKDIVENSGYNITRCGIIGRLFSTPISLSFFKHWKKIRNKYDIIHLHLPNPLAVLALFLFRSRSKIIIHWHSDIVKQKKLLFLFKPFQTWILKRCDKVIVTSPIYGENSVALKNYQNKLICIPIGIEKERLPENELFLSEMKNKFHGKKIVFSLGRLVYYKGFDYLIDAAKYLPEDIVILIGGQGELYEELNAFIKNANLGDKVHLLGSISFDKLSSYYKLCDVFCLPSIHKSEAFGVVQLEAMSYKKPLVSTDIPGSGVSWVNLDGYSGVVVQPKNSKLLAAGIVHVLENKDVMSKNSYQRFRQIFTKKDMINSINELYFRMNKL
ncbi:glycosyltransferase [Escherichia coli]